VLSIEHPRTRRWLLTLRDRANQSMLLLVQSRALISAADVQDLAELVHIRSVRHGVLWAYDGVFSPGAQRTRTELGAERLTLCTTLPPDGTMSR